MSLICYYANAVFQDRVQTIISTAWEIKEGALLPSRYVLAVTDENGQDKANDLSHIAKVRQRNNGKPDIGAIEDLRIFHGLALASSYVVAEGVGAVMWIRKKRYAWA